MFQILNSILFSPLIEASSIPIVASPTPVRATNSPSAGFARSGGEANAIAIRIARAATGKEKVAICGYHGWHDWYLSANLQDDKSLDGHLFPGLEPQGVPRNLRGTVFPFNYNNFSQLEELVKTDDIGVIKMEVMRNQGPQDNFLQKVRKLATDRGIVLIFDECTSGFRETYGGLHLKYGVNPDMAMFGKSLGNGYAITAVIGKREVMEAAQRSFISSTFFTVTTTCIAATFLGSFLIFLYCLLSLFHPAFS
jgi:glutamate-1-semialdehyde 2,1-aminomutase